MTSGYQDHLAQRSRSIARSRTRASTENQVDTFGIRVEQILHYAPEMAEDPAALIALARSPVPTTELGSASANALARARYSEIAEARSQISEAEQRAWWATDSPERKQMLRDAGYSPPDEQESKSWFRLGVGVPTFVPWVGGKHVTLSPGHENPVANVAAGAVTALAMPFKAADRGTRAVGGAAFSGWDALQEHTTNIGRAMDRSGWSENFAASVAFDKELRYRVERQVGTVDQATWRASTEGLIELPSRAELGAQTVIENLSAVDPSLGDKVASSYEATEHFNWFRQQGGSSSERIRLIAEEVATKMRSEGITDTVTFWDAYSDTYNGEAYVSPSRRNQAVDQYLNGDFEALRLAEAIMAGKSFDEVAAQNVDAAADPEGFLEEVRRLRDLAGGQDPEKLAQFEDAVTELGHGRYSIGRDAARSFGFTEGTLAYNIASGGIDALTILTVDPTLGIGKAYRGARGVSWVVKNLDGLDRTYNRAKASLGLLEQGSPAWGRALVDVASNSDQARALRVAGEAGLNYNEATRILGDRVADLGRADYQRMMKEGGARNSVTARARSMQNQGAISQWLATERIATAFRRTEGGEDAIKALEQLTTMDRATAARALRSGELDAIWNSTAIGDLLQDLPHLTGGMGDLIRWHHQLITTTGKGIRSAEDVWGFYRSTAGQASLSVSGNIRGSNTWLRNGYELPRLTAGGRKRIRAKAWFNDVIDWTHDRSISLDGPVRTHIGRDAPDFLYAVEQSHRTLRVADSLIGQYMDPTRLEGWRRLNLPARAASKTVRVAGDFVHSITTQLPLSTQLHLAGEGFGGGIVAFERFAELGRLGNISSGYRRLALDEFVRGGVSQLGNSAMMPASAATRAVLFRGMIADIADGLGIADSPAMRKYLEGRGVRAYAPNNLDLIDMHGAKIPAAIVPGVQMSDALAIPDFVTLTAQARRQGVLAKTLGVVNHPIVDRFFTSYWRPAMLLRLGFIPRAAGEELLTYAARHGIADYMVHVAASYSSNTEMAVKRMLANGDEAWDLVPRQVIGARGANKLMEHLSREMLIGERLALYPVVDRLHAAGRRLPKARRLAGRLEASFTRVKSDVLPHLNDKQRRIWVYTRGTEDPILFDSLAEINHHLWRRHSKLSYADVPEEWVLKGLGSPEASLMRDSILNKAVDVDHRAIFAGPLETPLVVSRYLAEKASILPRELIAKFLPDALVESAMMVRRGQMLQPQNIDVSAMELTTLSAIQDAIGQVDGQGGGRWLSKSRNTDGLARVEDVAGDEVILRFTNEFRRAGADDPMFHVKVTNSLNALQESWAIKAGVAEVGGTISPAQSRRVERVASAIADELSPRTLGEYMAAAAAPGEAAEAAIAGMSGAGLPDTIGLLNGLVTDIRIGPRWSQRVLREAFDEGIDSAATWVPRDMLQRFADGARPGETVTIRRILANSENEALEVLSRHWDDLPQEIQALIAEGHLFELASHEDIVTTFRNAMRAAMEDPEHSFEMARAQRMTVTSDGRPAAMLQPEHTERVYVPMLDDATAEQLGHIHANQYEDLVERIHFAQADPGVISYLVNDMLPHFSTSDVDAARQTASQIGRGATRPTLPVSNRGVHSPDLARDVSQLLNEIVTDMVGGVPSQRGATYGIIERLPGFNYGSHKLPVTGRYANTEVTHLTRVDTAGRITPIDPNTATMRYSRTPDEAGLHRLDEAGDIVVEGVGPEVLMDDWADQLTKVGQHYLFDNDGGLLHQITGPGSRRRIKEADIRRMGSSIPESVVHQHMVLPEELSGNLWQKIVAHGYDQIIGPAVSSIVRNPMFVRQYHQARQAATPLWNRAINEARTPGVDRIARRVKVEPSELIPLRRDWQEQIELARKRGAPIHTANDEIEWLASLGHRIDVNDLKELDVFVDSLESFHQKLAGHTAARAVNDMIPYIDDHRFRSQLAGHMRNLAPFWFAEETFMKRWARTLKHSPEAFRRAQLYVGALENTGIIQRDQFGQQVMVYPGGEILQEVLAPVTKHFFGEEMTIPLSVPFTGQVNYMMPGLDRQGIPSFSPLVAVPIGALANMFPELMSVSDTEALFGVRSLHQGLLDQVIPSWAARAIDAVAPTAVNEQRMAALSIQAIQQMEAEGQRALHEARQAEAAGDTEAAASHRERAALMMFPATSDPYLVGDYTDRVKSWARNLLIAQAVLGFMAPATPMPEFPNEITRQFLDLTRTGMPFDEALGYMLAQDPGATPFTRFGTKSATGAVIPSHVEAGAWVDENVEWLNSWRHAASWAIPQSEPDSAFDSMVYYQQLHMGLRERKSPAEFLEDVKFAEAAPLYFESQRNYERMMLDLRRRRDAGDDVRAQMNETDVAWDAWKASYLNQHPLFAQRLSSADGKQQRERTLSQMRLMLADPGAPEIAHRDQLETMLDSYDELNRLLGTMHGRSDPEATEYRHQVRLAFMGWAEDYIVSFPSVMNFYRSVIEPEANLRNTVLIQEVR